MNTSKATALLREIEEMLHHCHSENEIASGIDLRHAREAVVALAHEIREGRFSAQPLEDLQHHASNLMLHEPHRFQAALDELREVMRATPASEAVSGPAQP
jgi:hypothetical protein